MTRIEGFFVNNRHCYIIEVKDSFGDSTETKEECLNDWNKQFKSLINPNVVYIENSNGKVKCSIEPLINSSLIQYEWLKNGVVSNDKNNEIFFDKINSSQVQGNYICQIKINNGQILTSQTFNLSVYSSIISLMTLYLYKK